MKDKELEKIVSLYKEYSAFDIAISLYIFTTWLPNNSIVITSQILFYLLFSNYKNLSKLNKINNYDDFKEFIDKLIPIVPSLPSYQDLPPFMDWGEVKYYYKERLYNIIYGIGLSCSYDYRTAYEILSNSISTQFDNDKFQEQFQTLLEFEDSIIRNLPNKKGTKSLNAGHMEVPSKGFWRAGIEFLKNPSYLSTVDKFKDNNSVFDIYNFPIFSQANLKLEQLYEMAFDWRLILGKFLSIEDVYIPILPNNFFPNDYNDLGIYLQKNLTNSESKSHFMKLVSVATRSFISQRLKEGTYLSLVTTIQERHKKDVDFIILLCFINENKLYIFNYLPVITDIKEYESFLKNLQPKIKSTIENFKKGPIEFADLLRPQKVQIKNIMDTEIRWINLIPTISTTMTAIPIPENMPGEVMFLVDFLGLIDESKDKNEIAGFIEYWLENNHSAHPITSVMDFFGSYRDSSGVLIEGANQPNFIFIDLSWGTNYRYKSLSKFWSKFPLVSYIGHPRSWTLEEHGPDAVRMRMRPEGIGALSIQVGKTTIFVTSPLAEQTKDAFYRSESLMQVYIDYLSRYKTLLKNLDTFKVLDRLNIIIFPSELVSLKGKYNHVSHLIPDNDCPWASDSGIIKPGEAGYRLVYDFDKLSEVLLNAKDRSALNDFFQEFITKLTFNIGQEDLSPIIKKLNKERTDKPRFTTEFIQEEASFPDLRLYVKPEPYNFKIARNNIAQIAKELSIQQGKYTIEEAKLILNKLIIAMVSKIDSEIKKYSFSDSIHMLIANSNSLIHSNKLHNHTINNAINNEVDYDPIDASITKYNEYTKLGHSYNYLIEKFVYLKPSGSIELNDSSLANLLGMIDWLLSFYNNSDSIEFNLDVVEVVIDHNFIVDVIYSKDFDKKEKLFETENKLIEMGKLGNASDAVKAPLTKNDKVKVDNAFASDLGFTFNNFLNVLEVLTFWAYYKKIQNNAYYMESFQTIYNTIKTIPELKDMKRKELECILNFLILDREKMSLRTTFQDLPVSERNRRPQRLNLKPLIFLDGKYYWGPYSTKITLTIWSNQVSEGMLPFRMEESKNISKSIENLKMIISNELADKALEIAKRITINTCKGLFPHKRFPKIWKEDIGDFDVLVYLEKTNTIVSIECNDISPAFTLADADSMRNTLFIKKKNKIEKIMKRHKFLEDNGATLLKELKWPIKDGYKVESLYLSRRIYWWCKYPPKEYLNLEFTIPQLLESILNNYNEETGTSSE